MWLFCKTAWNSGFRGRSFHAVFFLAILLIGLAYLAASFSARQPQTVALDVGFTAIRFSLVLLTLFWVQELIGKEIEKRTVFFALTYPVARSAYILGRFAGIVSLALLATVILGLILLGSVTAATWGYQQSHPVDLMVPFWATLAGIWLDVTVVAAFAVLISTVASSAVFPLLMGAIFAIMGKSLGQVLAYLAAGADGDTGLVNRFQPVLSTLQWVLPDLNRLDWRAWSLYQTPPDQALVLISVVMALAYVAILLSLASLVFSRRQFA